VLGTVVDGRYRIIGRLGAGGMAVVFLAFDDTLGREVALKVMQPELSAIEKVVKRFQREIAVCARLDHPNVIRIYDVGTLDDGSLYYVMELLECQSLADRLEAGAPLPEDEARDVIAGVADALAYVHPQGLVHRDLKPSNIMLPAPGRPKVVDFGLVHDQAMTRLTKTGEMVGTPQYCTPELIEGLGVDGRSDIFQLGTIAYEVLTGRKAFGATSLEGLLGAIMAGARPRLPDQPPELRGRWQPFLDGCLACDPEDRFQTAADARQAVDDPAFAAAATGAARKHASPTVTSDVVVQQLAADVQETAPPSGGRRGVRRSSRPSGAAKYVDDLSGPQDAYDPSDPSATSRATARPGLVRALPSLVALLLVVLCLLTLRGRPATPATTNEHELPARIAAVRPARRRVRRTASTPAAPAPGRRRSPWPPRAPRPGSAPSRPPCSAP